MPEENPIYPNLTFPLAPPNRPYIFINMVTTIDGKITTGDRNDHVMDLGTDLDHATMRHIESQADAVIIGAGNLRATPKLWYPKNLIRLVVTQSGNIQPGCKFFTDAPEKAYVVTTEETAKSLPAHINAITSPGSIHWPRILKELKHSLNIHKLLVEGGSKLNASILSQNVVDELFLTLAPKIKMGHLEPTYADGKPLPREAIQNYEILQVQQAQNEVFLRYRRIK